MIHSDEDELNEDENEPSSESDEEVPLHNSSPAVLPLLGCRTSMVEGKSQQELEKEIEELKKEIEMYQNVISTAFGSVSVMYEMFGKKLQEFVNKKAGKQVATLKYDSPTEERMISGIQQQFQNIPTVSKFVVQLGLRTFSGRNVV